MASVGYSGTPLSKKLGLKEGLAVSWVDGPSELLGLKLVVRKELR